MASLVISPNSPVISAYNSDSFNTLGKRYVMTILSEIFSINASNNWNQNDNNLMNAYLFNQREYKELLLAKDISSQETLGYLLYRRDFSSNERAYLSFIATTKKLQKKGIGSLLFSHGIENMIKNGFKSVTLDCEESSLRFYLKFANDRGYRITCRKIKQSYPYQCTIFFN